MNEEEFDYKKEREDAVRALHELIKKHWCDEFEYGESCKHCCLEQTLCEPLAEAMYPDIFKPPDSEL